MRVGRLDLVARRVFWDRCPVRHTVVLVVPSSVFGAVLRLGQIVMLTSREANIAASLGKATGILTSVRTPLVTCLVLLPPRSGASSMVNLLLLRCVIRLLLCNRV